MKSKWILTLSGRVATSITIAVSVVVLPAWYENVQLHTEWRNQRDAYETWQRSDEKRNCDKLLKPVEDSIAACIAGMPQRIKTACIEKDQSFVVGAKPKVS